MKNERKIELKPCPFCGCSNIRIAGGVSIAFLHCRNCKAEMCRMINEDFEFGDEPLKTAEDYAIEAWNRRAEDGN